MSSQDLNRVKKQSILEEDHFNPKAVFVTEYKNILAWLREQANNALSPNTATVDSALKLTGSHLLQIQNIFGKSTVANNPLAKNPSLMTAASRGELAKHAPSRSKITAYRVLMLITAFSELGIGVLLWALGEGNPVVVAIAAFLAAGGWLAGNGLGGIFLQMLKFPENWHDNPEVEGMGKEVAKLITGIVITVSLAVLRTGGQEEGALYVVAATILLAALVAMFESLYRYYNDKYDYLHDRMFHCQQWLATEQHEENCAKKDEGYADNYKGFVMSIATEFNKTHEPQIR